MNTFRLVLFSLILIATLFIEQAHGISLTLLIGKPTIILDSVISPTAYGRIFIPDSNTKKADGSEIIITDSIGNHYALTLNNCLTQQSLPISIAISADISGSMYWSDNKFPISPVQIEDAFGVQLTNRLDFTKSEELIQICDDVARVMSPFTQNKTILDSDWQNTPRGYNNDFIEQIFNPNNGLLVLTRGAKYRKTAIIITDALWPDFTQRELQQALDECKAESIQFYAIVVSTQDHPISSSGNIGKSLQTLCDSTGGKLYDSVITIGRVDSIVTKFITNASLASPCDWQLQLDFNCNQYLDLKFYSSELNIDTTIRVMNPDYVRIDSSTLYLQYDSTLTLSICDTITTSISWQSKSACAFHHDIDSLVFPENSNVHASIVSKINDTIKFSIYAWDSVTTPYIVKLYFDRNKSPIIAQINLHVTEGSIHYIVDGTAYGIIKDSSLFKNPVKLCSDDTAFVTITNLDCRLEKLFLISSSTYSLLPLDTYPMMLLGGGSTITARFIYHAIDTTSIQTILLGINSVDLHFIDTLKIQFYIRIDSTLPPISIQDTLRFKTSTCEDTVESLDISNTTCRAIKVSIGVDEFSIPQGLTYNYKFVTKQYRTKSVRFDSLQVLYSVDGLNGSHWVYLYDTVIQNYKDIPNLEWSNFDTTSKCDSSYSDILLQNPWCGPITIDTIYNTNQNIILNRSAFLLDSTELLKATFIPNGRAGADTGSIIIRTKDTTLTIFYSLFSKDKQIILTQLTAKSTGANAWQINVEPTQDSISLYQYHIILRSHSEDLTFIHFASVDSGAIIAYKFNDSTIELFVQMKQWTTWHTNMPLIIVNGVFELGRDSIALISCDLNVNFDYPDSTYCVADILPPSPIAIEYDYRCGDKTIQELLNKNLHVGLIIPNPSLGTITITYYENTTVTIYNLMGEKASEIQTNQSTKLNLPSGTYMVHINDLNSYGLLHLVINK